jgi:hypothetical protein
MNRHGHETEPTAPRSFWRSRSGVTLLVFLGIAAFYLLTEHTAHLLGALPYLLVLACPLMHLFMHGGHGRHAGHGPPEDSRSVR